MEFDTLFDRLATFLHSRYPKATNLDGIIDYQRNLVILPDYDRNTGKTFPTKFDWISYFAKASRLTAFELLDEPAAVSDAVIDISDQSCGITSLAMQPLEWKSDDEEDRWAIWIDRTVIFRNSAAKSNFQQLRLRTHRPSLIRAH